MTPHRRSELSPSSRAESFHARDSAVNDPSAREALDEDGWMHTGDLGVLDDEGCCRIVGR